MMKLVFSSLLFLTLTFTVSTEARDIKVVQTEWEFNDLDDDLFQRMENLDGIIESELNKYSYDFKLMSDEALKNIIESQKEYVDVLQELNASLNSIYFAKSDALTPVSAEEEISNATREIIKKCGLLKKFTNNCLDRKERLLFQAEYLNEKILDLEIQKTTLLNGIQFQIEQQDHETFNISL